MVAARAEGQRPLNVALRETTLSLLTFEGQPRAFSRKFIFFTLLQPSEAENQPKKKRRDYVVTDVCPRNYAISFENSGQFACSASIHRRAFWQLPIIRGHLQAWNIYIHFSVCFFFILPTTRNWNAGCPKLFWQKGHSPPSKKGATMERNQKRAFLFQFFPWNRSATHHLLGKTNRCIEFDCNIA